MANSVRPRSVLGPHFLLVYLNSPVMLVNYLQQTTSADDIFRCIFLGTLRVNSTCWVILHTILSSADFFSQSTFPKNSFRNTIGVSNSLDPDQAQHFVVPDLKLRDVCYYTKWFWTTVCWFWTTIC